MNEDQRDIDSAKADVKAMNRARNFPVGTCPWSRHTAMIAENLAKRGGYPMLQEEPRHCASSLAVTVRALWQARAMLQKLGYENPDGKGWKKAARPRMADRGA